MGTPDLQAMENENHLPTQRCRMGSPRREEGKDDRQPLPGGRRAALGNSLGRREGPAAMLSVPGGRLLIPAGLVVKAGVFPRAGERILRGGRADASWRIAGTCRSLSARSSISLQGTHTECLCRLSLPTYAVECKEDRGVAESHHGSMARSA